MRKDHPTKDYMCRRRNTLGTMRPLRNVHPHCSGRSDHAKGRMTISMNEWPCWWLSMVGPTNLCLFYTRESLNGNNLHTTPKDDIIRSYLFYMVRRALRSWNLNSKIFPIRKDTSYKGSWSGLTPLYKHQTSFSSRYTENF